VQKLMPYLACSSFSHEGHNAQTMEMKKFITFQMLQSEENARQMIIQGQGENTLQVNQLSPKKMYN